MTTSDSSPRRRPPDKAGVIPQEQPAKRQRRSQRWKLLRNRFRDALSQVRVLIFVHIEDEKKCLRVRGMLLGRAWRISWMTAVRLLHTTSRSDLEQVLADLEGLGTLSFDEQADTDHLDRVLSTLLTHVMIGHVHEYRPLLSKLSSRKQYLLSEVIDTDMKLALDGLLPQQDRPNFKSWFQFRTQSTKMKTELSLSDLHVFPHTKKWVCDEDAHTMKCDAFDCKEQRTQDVTNANIKLNALKKEQHSDQLDAVKEDLKRLKAEKKLMVCRTRKYRLFPTAEQQQRLRMFMGTCRWTYNQAVAHFKKTNVYQASTLRDLYITQTSKKVRVYPDEMEPPPEWVFDTPKTLRYNTLRKFQTNVKSAFSNLKNGNISKFNIRFKSKKDCRFFTFCEDGDVAKIKYDSDLKQAFLSISCLKDIPIRCDPGLIIENEIQIMNTNGFWYAAIPQFVRPSIYENQGRCVALDPGMKAFMTGVDLNGNVLHIGRNNKEHLDALRERASLAQQAISNIKNTPGHRSRKQWKAYVIAKRAFNVAVAKLKNCVKELHYQTCSYLTKHYDTIILPIFQTRDMVKKSSSRTHGFNTTILSLNHFQFRELLRAKCELMGEALVLCSEMYSSMTCGNCSRLHLKLGNQDVFDCPHCEHVAGRDVNGAFNILRFVCSGSLAVSNIY